LKFSHSVCDIILCKLEEFLPSCIYCSLTVLLVGCLAGPDILEQYACEGDEMYISCGKLVIHIVDANYGRLDNSMCANQLGIPNDNCRQNATCGTRKWFAIGIFYSFNYVYVTQFFLTLALCKWIAYLFSYLITDTKWKILLPRISNTSEVRQGCILGPIVFCIAMHLLLWCHMMWPATM